MAWNPTEGLHLLTASSDDRNPVLKLWDLRSSTTVPLTTLQGHQQGVLSMSWCPHDESLLLSSGKDNRTLLWDLHSMTCVADLPNEQDPAAAGGVNGSSVYSASLSSSQTGLLCSVALCQHAPSITRFSLTTLLRHRPSLVVR